jgi:hypothetical protein
MTFARKLELTCGSVMGLLGVAILVWGIREKYAVSVRLNRLPDFFPSIIGLLIILVCPCLLVTYGSFIHAVKQRDWGKVLLVIGCIFLIGYFLLASLTLALIAILNSPLLICLWVMAIVTLIVCFVVERQNKKALSPP